MSAIATPQSSLIRFALLSPLYAAYGAWVVVVSLVRLVRWVMWTIRLARPELVCSACGSKATSLYGRWECRSAGCGAIYVGAADCCARCGAGASMVFCVDCGASILLRPAR